MKNYNKNLSYNTSREYYLNVLKSDNKNLNLSKNKLDIFDLYLEKLLDISYKVFAPIFNEEETYLTPKNDYQYNNIDLEFDEQLEKNLPKWINKLLNVLNIIYHKFFTKEIVKYAVKSVTKTSLTIILLVKSTFKLCQNKFFKINSSP